jgi:hypothetical protein
MLRSLIRLGQIDRAGLFLAGLSGEERERGEVRVGAAEVELARGNPSAALAELAAIQEGPGSGYYWGFWQVRAHGQVRTADPHHEQRDRQCQIQPTVLAPRTAFPVCVQLAASPRG